MMHPRTLRNSVYRRVLPWAMFGAGLQAAACSGTSDGSGGVSTSGGASSMGASVGGTLAFTATISTGGLSGATTSLPGAGGISTASSAVGGSSVGGLTSLGGRAGGSSEAGGASSVASTAAGGSSTSAGGSKAIGGSSASGGTTAKGGSSSRGGATSAGGSGGTSTTGGATAKGGTTGSGGTSTTGGAGYLCSAGVWDGTTKPTPLTLSGNTFAHDPTMIAVNGTYYRYWTGNNIPAAKSTNLTNWTNISSVYTNGYSAWTTTWLAGISGQTFNFPWAPDVSYFNGNYHIYSSFSAKFGDNISCITHLSTSDPGAGGWKDNGTVICTSGSENYNAIDADVGLDAAGNPYLAFGSFWNGIMATPLNADGTRQGTTLTRIASASQIEAPVLFYRCGFYYLFVTWGLCCPGEGRSISQLTYRVAVGRSTNILGPYVDKTGTSMLNGGGFLMVQGDKVNWAAAGHSDVLVSGNKIYHLYHAYRQSNGEAQLRIVEMPFDSEGWPVPAGP